MIKTSSSVRKIRGKLHDPSGERRQKIDRGKTAARVCSAVVVAHTLRPRLDPTIVLRLPLLIHRLSGSASYVNVSGLPRVQRNVYRERTRETETFAENPTRTWLPVIVYPTFFYPNRRGSIECGIECHQPVTGLVNLATASVCTEKTRLTCSPS